MYKYYILQLVNKIKEFYSEFDIFGLPHPGDDIEYEDYTGDGEIDDDFKEMVIQYNNVIIVIQKKYLLKN